MLSLELPVAPVMENDEEAFATDPNFLADLRSRSRPVGLSTQRQQNPRGFSTDGAKEAHNGRYEDTPLLSRDVDAESETCSDGHENRNEAALAWSGARDFEGRPWWNRPSVSLNALLVGHRLCNSPSDILAAAGFPALYAGVRRHCCPENQPHTRPDMQRIFG